MDTTVGRANTNLEMNLSTCTSSAGRKGNNCRGGLHYRIIAIRKMAANTQNHREQQETWPLDGHVEKGKGFAQV